MSSLLAADRAWLAHGRRAEMVQPKRATGLYASMDLTGVVSTLESHWVVLDAELSEIRKDFATLRALTRKHGDFWSRPMAQLKKLRAQKENLLKESAARAPPRVPACAASPHLLTRRTALSRDQDQIPNGALQPPHSAGARPMRQALERRLRHQDAPRAAAVPARDRGSVAHPRQLAEPAQCRSRAGVTRAPVRAGSAEWALRRRSQRPSRSAQRLAESAPQRHLCAVGRVGLL